MDYTQSDANMTDGGTGQRMHQSTAPITTEVSSDDMNAVNWELLELIKAADLVPAAFDKAVPATYSQVRAAVAVMSRKQSAAIASATGSADVLIGAFTPEVPALVNGLTVYLRAAYANATTTPTFTPHDGTIAAKDIVKGNGMALVASDIAGAGHWLTLKYDLTLDKWVLMNPSMGVGILPALAAPNGSSKVAHLPDGIGAVATTVQQQLRNLQRRMIFVEDAPFYAIGGGVFDDVAAIQAAAYYASLLGGGDVMLSPGRIYLIDSADLIVPAFVTIRGGSYASYDLSNTTSNLAGIPGLRLNPLRTIVLHGSGRLCDISVLRKGIDDFENNTALFSGTAVETVPYEDDQSIENMVALGFEKLVTATSNQRVTITDFKGDGVSGISLSDSKDVSRLTRVHLWPYVTVGGVGADRTARGGIGIELAGGVIGGTLPVDWATVNECFTYGYHRGYRFQNAANCSLINSAADHDPSYSGIATTICVLADPHCEYLKIDNCTLATSVGLSVNADPSSSIASSVSNTRFRANPANSIDLNQGVLKVNSCEFTDSATGISINSANETTRLLLTGVNAFSASVINPIYGNAVSENVVIDGTVIWEAAPGSSLINGANPSLNTVIPTAGVVNLRTHGRSFKVATGEVSEINGGWTGREVTLWFQGASLVINSGVLMLGGGVNFAAVSNSTITLMALNNGTWIEKGRKA